MAYISEIFLHRLCHIHQPQPVVSHRGTASRATLVLMCSREQGQGTDIHRPALEFFKDRTRVRPGRKKSCRVPVRQENRYRSFHQPHGGPPIQRSGYGKRRTFLRGGRCPPFWTGSSGKYPAGSYNEMIVALKL